MRTMMTPLTALSLVAGCEQKMPEGDRASPGRGAGSAMTIRVADAGAASDVARTSDDLATRYEVLATFRGMWQRIATIDAPMLAVHRFAHGKLGTHGCSSCVPRPTRGDHAASVSASARAAGTACT